MNTHFSLPLEKMTVAEKLDALDLIWNDLRRNAEKLPVPEWHLKELDEAEKATANGTEEFIDIDEFEAELREDVE